MDLKNEYCRVEEIARLFNKTTRRIQQLTQDGILSTESVKENGRKARRYNLEKTIKAYLEHIENIAKGKEKKKTDKENESAKLAAEVRYKEAKAEAMELQLKEQKAQLHRSEDVEKIVGDNIATLRSMLLALPGQLAVDTANTSNPMQTSEIIKKAVYRILSDLADYSYDNADYKALILERYGISGEEHREEKG